MNEIKDRNRNESTGSGMAFRLGALAVLLAFTVSGALAQVHVAERRGASGASCPCPCEIQCGNGVSCSCSGSEGRCYCGQIAFSAESMSKLMEATTLSLKPSFAPWIGGIAYEKISAAFEATMTDSGRRETLSLSFAPTTGPGGLFVLSPSQATSYRRWRARVDKRQPGSVSFAVSGDSPGNYAIKDGDLGHFNESVQKLVTIATPRGPVAVFSSDSTLAWEMQHYLRSTVTCLDDAAYAGDPKLARTELYGVIDEIDILVKASDFTGAAIRLGSIQSTLSDIGVAPTHPHAARLLAAFSTYERLLTRR